MDDISAFHLSLKRKTIFSNIANVEPSETLSHTLNISRRLPLGNEKAKSEMLVAPVLSEIWSRNEEVCTLFSGYVLDVQKEQGLTGRCDFIFSGIDSIVIEAPLLAIVEAKNDNIEDAVPQCAAQMLASQIFNDRKGRTVPIIHGVTTNGYDWLFLRLHGSLLEVHNDLYQLRNLPELLGVLQHIINYYKELSFTTGFASAA
jgi:hypothetical protein